MISLVGAESQDSKTLKEKVCMFLQRTNEPQPTQNENANSTISRPLVGNGADPKDLT
jgi:hypothetical protein